LLLSQRSKSNIVHLTFYSKLIPVDLLYYSLFICMLFHIVRLSLRSVKQLGPMLHYVQGMMLSWVLILHQALFPHYLGKLKRHPVSSSKKKFVWLKCHTRKVQKPVTGVKEQVWTDEKRFQFKLNWFPNVRRGCLSRLQWQRLGQVSPLPRKWMDAWFEWAQRKMLLLSTFKVRFEDEFLFDIQVRWSE